MTLTINEPAVATRKIVVCDDNNDILNYLGALLEAHGYCPLMARSLADVRYYVENESPELLLLDICLPDNDGFEIGEGLRSKGVSVPILYMTAHDNTFCRVYAPHLASGYFTKPIDDDALLTRIRQLLPETPVANPAQA